MRAVATAGLALLFLVGCGARSTTNWDESALRESADQTVYDFLVANSSLEFVNGPDGGQAVKLPGEDRFVGLFINGELKGRYLQDLPEDQYGPFVPDASLLTELRVSEVASMSIEPVAGYGEYSGAVRITLRSDSDTASGTSK